MPIPSWAPNTWILNKGDDEQIMVHLIDVNGAPINISGASLIQLLIKNADNSVLTLAAVSGIAVGLGQPFWVYTFTLTAAETALLPIVSAAKVEVQVTFGGPVQKYAIQSSLTVVAPLI